MLEAWIIARTTQAAVLSSVAITVNGDTGANYDWESVTGNGAAASALASLAQAAWGSAGVPGASATAGEAAVLVITIPLYAGTTFRKQGTLYNSLNEPSAANSNFAIAASLSWRNTAAITQMKVAAGSGNLVAGSSLLIYGRS